MRATSWFAALFLGLLFGGLALGADTQTAPSADRRLTFERDVRPVPQKALLSMPRRRKNRGRPRCPDGAAAFGRRRSVRAVIAGKSHASLIVERLNAGEMPPEKIHLRLTAREIATIARWIDEGAETARPEPADPALLPKITDEDRRPLGVFAGEAICCPIDGTQRGRLRMHGRADADRRLHPPAAEYSGPGALDRGGPGHAHPPAVARPDRPAARAGRNRGLLADDGRLVRDGWSIACWPRRTTASAGAGTGSTSPATPTPRATPTPTPPRTSACKYRDYVIRSLQRRQAVRPVHHRAARRRRTGASRRTTNSRRPTRSTS